MIYALDKLAFFNVCYPAHEESNQRGFTLIELSIVLVIIGLLVGGVLVGRDLIHAAEIRATVKQVEQLDAAVNTFRVKYNCLPGDCTNAGALGFSDYQGNSSSEGDGNGQIDFNSTYYNRSEDLNAIAALKQSGLLADPLAYPDNLPLILTKLPTFSAGNAKVGSWFIEYNDGTGTNNLNAGKAANWYVMASFYNFNNAATDFSVLLPVDAFAIDSKVDDGLPNSGSVLATSGISGVDGITLGGAGTDAFFIFADGVDTGPAGSASNFCVTSLPYKYNALNTSGAAGSLCTLLVKGSF